MPNNIRQYPETAPAAEAPTLSYWLAQIEVDAERLEEAVRTLGDRLHGPVGPLPEPAGLTKALVPVPLPSIMLRLSHLSEYLKFSVNALAAEVSKL